METGDIIELTLVFAVVVVPSLGLTARFVLKPVVDALVRLKEGGLLSGGSGSQEMLQLRSEVRQLREEMASLHGSVERLREAEEFNRVLRDTSPPAALPPRADA